MFNIFLLQMKLFLVHWVKIINTIIFTQYKKRTPEYVVLDYITICCARLQVCA